MMMTKKDNEIKDHAGQVNTRKPASQGLGDHKPQHRRKLGEGFSTRMSDAAARLTIPGCAAGSTHLHRCHDFFL